MCVFFISTATVIYDWFIFYFSSHYPKTPKPLFQMSKFWFFKLKVVLLCFKFSIWTSCYCGNWGISFNERQSFRGMDSADEATVLHGLLQVSFCLSFPRILYPALQFLRECYKILQPVSSLYFFAHNLLMSHNLRHHLVCNQADTHLAIFRP